MKLMRYFLLGSATILFLAVLALPSLASEVKEESFSQEYRNSVLAQITPTAAYTVYLPIVINPANNLSITALNYSGSDEYITISNAGPANQSMNGWQIVSASGSQVFNFPNGITLVAGSSLRVHSGPSAINNPPNDLFWSTAYLWNNNGDKAELIDSGGNIRDSYCYGDWCP